jgi:hypothetical protein
VESSVARAERFELRQVAVRLVEGSERERWDELMRRHHYLGLRALVGESLRYVAEVGGRWLALVGWCTGAFKCGVRDRWIGWEGWVQWRRLHLVANNGRFLLLPGERVGNLASRVLGLSLRRLSADWQRQHGHGIVVAETFVDPRRFAGTCYRAAGWTELGPTRGFARQAGRYRAHGQSKQVWVRIVDRKAWARLADPRPDPRLDLAGPPRAMRMTYPQADTLWEVLLALPDPRQRRGRRHSKSSLLALAICAVLGGARSLTAIAEATERLPQRLLKRLGCRFEPRRGRYEVPSEATFRRFLKALDPRSLEAALSGWFHRVGVADAVLALDGKTLRGARRRDAQQLHLLSVFAGFSGVVLAQREVPAQSNEIPVAQPLLEPLPLAGKVVTADALHTQEKLARFLVEDKQADYVLPVRDNQPTLKQDLEACFAEAGFPPRARDDRQTPRPAGSAADLDE